MYPSDRKLPESVERIVWSRAITPVIVKVRPEKFFDISRYMQIRVLDYLPKIKALITDRIEDLFSKFLEIKYFNMFSITLPRELVFELAEVRGVEKIYYNKPVYCLQYPTVCGDGIYEIPTGLFTECKKIHCTSTYWTKKLVGCDKANKMGFTGKGIKVSAIDTGAFPFHALSHVKLKSVLRTEKDYDCGHGQWITSCIASKPDYDKILYKRYGIKIPVEGMAPEADVIAYRALDYVIGMGNTDSVLKAIERSIFRYNVDIISLSLGGEVTEEKPEDDPYYYPMKYIAEIGKIVCAASGNSGPAPGTISSPGSMPDVLTVGAYDPLTGQLASFSSKGPVYPEPYQLIKPDCVAPGVRIYAHCTGLLDRSDRMSTGFSPLSGSSMSTPHVSGLIACMYQCHRKVLSKPLTVEEVKKMLQQLGHEKNNSDGWGVITWDMYLTWLSTEYGIEFRDGTPVKREVEKPEEVGQSTPEEQPSPEGQSPEEVVSEEEERIRSLKGGM
ncbi:hypothetical protein DRP04_00720 [Archaeoglobales archaeon]|nr:MAG: hypothetical protein DRP04_00720 [Archaeoglobales archaeon]